jgi:hypothetical protein
MIPVRNMLRGVPFLIPVLYAAVILWLQPADRMGPPEKAPILGQLLYDDYDVTAFALRGLNAHLGRIGGLADNPEHLAPADFNDVLDDPTLTLKPGYYLEYPHPCLLLFRLGYVWQADVSTPPPAFLDAGYPCLVEHQPRNDSERQIWRQLRNAERTYVVLMAVCLILLMAVLYVGYEPGVAAPVWLLILPASLYFAINRFDVVVVLLTALSFACLGRRHVAAAAICLAMAAALKVYPVVLAPLMLAYVARERHGWIVWTSSFVATLALLLLPTLILSGWDSFWGPYRFQLGRSPIAPNVADSVSLVSWLHTSPWTPVLRAGVVLSVVGLLCVPRMNGLESLLRRSALAVGVFVSMAVYSPQWFLWFAPFLVPLAASQRRFILPLVVVDLMTYLTFPVALVNYQEHSWQPLCYDVSTTLRIAVQGLLLATLAWMELRPNKPSVLGNGQRAGVVTQ